MQGVAVATLQLHCANLLVTRVLKQFCQFLVSKHSLAELQLAPPRGGGGGGGGGGGLEGLLVVAVRCEDS